MTVYCVLLRQKSNVPVRVRGVGGEQRIRVGKDRGGKRAARGGILTMRTH